MTESDYYLYSIILSALTAIGAGIFGFWQILINKRLKKVNDYVAISIVPDDKNKIIKLLNTGKLNLYIHRYEIADNIFTFKKPRLITAGTMDSSYYYLQISGTHKEGEFDIKIYLTDEFDKKYLTEGGGEAVKEGEAYKITVWTNKTKKFKWKFSNIT